MSYDERALQLIDEIEKRLAAGEDSYKCSEALNALMGNFGVVDVSDDEKEQSLKKAEAILA